MDGEEAPAHGVQIRTASIIAALGAAALVAIALRGRRDSGGDLLPLLLPCLLAAWLVAWAFLRSIEQLTYRLFMRYLVPGEDWDELEAGVLLAIFAALSFAWTTASVRTVPMRYQAEVEARYGISIQTVTLRAGNRNARVVTLDRIEGWGAFARAGATKGDIVVSPKPAAALIRKLHITPPNTTLPVDVVPGGEGKELAIRPVRTLEVLVP